MGYFIQVIINGLMVGGVYALVAVGLNLIFGVMKIVNFAQGEFLMIGMYSAYTLYLVFQEKSTIGIYLMLIPSILLGGLIVVVLYLAFVQHVVGKDDTVQIILTMGLSFFLQGLAQIIYGSGFQSIPGTVHFSSFKLGPIIIQTGSFIAFLVAMVVALILAGTLRGTIWGKSVRAVAENRQIASILGVNARRIFLSAFAVGGLLAALGGALLSPFQYAYPTVGSSFVIIAFLVVVIAGLGNVNGSVLGGLLIGIVESLTAGYLSIDLSIASIYVIFILVLIFRPEGLFTKRGRTV